MKKIVSYLIVISITICIIAACGKMDSTYKEFIVPGGVTYAGKVTSLSAKSGHNRVQLAWLRGADPNVIKAKIFWNNFADSIEVPIPETGDTIKTYIENLPEKTYSFIVHTYDAKGRKSVPVEVFSTAYGDNYIAGLLNRAVDFNKKGDEGKKITIEWGGADLSSGAFATEVKYTDVLGNVQNKRFLITDATSVLLDVQPGANYEYRTLFRPDSTSVDSFFSNYEVKDYFALDNKEWKIAGFSSNFSAPETVVTNVIDGNHKTIWHTNVVGSIPYPHYCVIDLGRETMLKDVGLWRGTGEWRGPTKIQLMVSKDNITWTDMGIYNFDINTDSEQLFHLLPYQKARYFKVIGLAGPFYYMTLGEISLYGF